MFTNNKLAKSVRLAIAFGAAATALPATQAFANEEQAEEIERVQVTGSRIQRTDLESASPVVVISAADMENMGYSSVQDVLANLAQNNGGSLTQQSVHGFTPAASGVNLRNAGLGRTLTLLDGKRLPKYPVASGGTDNFIDTANLPLGAVERIEVLTTGASAIYGSDAMGGVINIILKDDFDGTSVKVRHGGTTGGGLENNTLSFTTGVDGEKGNILFQLEYEKKQRLRANQREKFDIHTDLAFDHYYSSYSSYGARIAGPGGAGYSLSEEECNAKGFVYWPGGPHCGFDRSQWRDLMPERERLTAMTKFHYDLSDSVRLTGRFDYTTSKSDTNIEPMAINDAKFYIGSDDSIRVDVYGYGETYADYTTAFGGDFAQFDAPAANEDGSVAYDRYEYRRRLYEFGHRNSDIRPTVANFTLGLEGDLTDEWMFEANWQFSESRVDSYNRGYTSAQNFANYLTSEDNGVSLFDLISEEDVATYGYTGWRESKSSLTGGSFVVNGPIFQLPAGEVYMAAGVEAYSEWFFDTSDEARQQGEILTTGGSSGRGSRDNWAAYAEIAIPVTDEIAVTAAGRYDDYSDFGNKFSPQVAVEYRPMDELLIRGLYAKTFRAPDMQRVYGDPTTGFSQITDPLGCTNAGGVVGDANSLIGACSGELYITSLTGPNKDLDPETGTNWNVGAVYSTDSFNFSIDFWEVEIDDIVNDLGAQTIANNYETYGNLITRDADGFIEFVNSTAQNLSYLVNAGVDIDAGYTLETDIGEFEAKINVSYLTKSESQFDSLSETDDNLEDGGTIEWRSTITLGYTKDDFSSTVQIRHLPAYNGIYTYVFDTDCNYSSSNEDYDAEYHGFLGDCKVDSYTTVNMSFGYQISDMFGIKGGVNNIFDEAPKVDPTDWGWPHYDRSNHDGVGTEYYFVLEANF